MSQATFLLGFYLESQRFAVRLEEVERVLRAVWVPSVPNAPPAVQGVLNVHGRMMPVVSLRARFSLPAKDPAIQDRIILAHAGDMSLAFFVDQVEGVISMPGEEVMEAGKVLPGLGGTMDGFGQFSDETIFIYSVGNLYSPRELLSFEEAMLKEVERSS